MNTPVSICLATYNGEKYIKEQLDSLINQTYSNFELIVQDDCSTDNTVAIVKSYEKKLNISLYINNKNLGYQKNFESLLQKATGEYILLCDQDDIWEEDKISILLQNIGNYSAIYSNSLLIDSEGNSLEKTLSQKLKNNFITSTNCLEFLYDNPVSAHAILFKRELLDCLFPFSEHFYFDAWIALNAANRQGIYFLDKTLVNYRQHATNAVGNKKKKKSSPLSKITQKVQKKENAINYLILKIKDLQNIHHISSENLILLKNMEKLYKKFEDSYFNLFLFLFLWKNKKQFFTVTTKNIFILILKSSIGKKLYRIAPFL